MCELTLEVYMLMKALLNQSSTISPAEHQVIAVLRQVFHTDSFSSLDLILIKPTCHDEGRYGGFAPVQCTYNVTTDKIVACYCMGPNGLIPSTIAIPPSSPKCDSE